MRMTKAMAKSMSMTDSTASGRATRGKYTFESKLGSCTRLFAARVIAFEKNVHGSSATYEKTGYATLSEGTWSRLLNTSENTTIVPSGCKTAHAPPMTVCL